jgi:hypothetical protein
MKWIFRGLGICALFVAAFILFGYATMYLWNWLMTDLFSLKPIDFYQAIGLVILSKILLGGMHMRGGGGWGQKRFWKAKWESMTPEEREKFKAEFAVRCKHKWGKAEAVAEPKQA